MKKQTEDNNYRIQTSIDNDSAELVKMECTNCGASLTVVDKTHAKCPFCGQNYLIDEAKGIVVNVNVDYGDSAEVRQSVKRTQRLLIGFLIAAVVVTAIIFAFNMAAHKSVFSSSDSDAPIQEKGNLLVIFCKDIFQKEYQDITPEEFASIRYIKYTYQRDGNSNDHYHVVYYSFTNYEECGSEEEFFDTVHTWTYEDSKASWPSDFTMLTGLTRIDTTDTVWLSSINFSPESKISYVTTDDNLEIVSSKVKPEYVKVLDLGIFGSNLNGLEQYQNLEVLIADNVHFNNETDLAGIDKCQKLKKLVLNCADTYRGEENLTKLSELKSLSMNGVVLSECDFLKELPQLEELSVAVGEDDTDLSMLTYLPNLKTLDTRHSEYIPVEPLLALKNLENLTVSVETKEDFEQLAQLAGLKTLHVYVSYDEIDEAYHHVPLDISVFSALPALENFQIEQSSMGSVCGAESLLNMPTLKSFAIGMVFSGNELFLDKELLEENPSLETFYANGLTVKDAVSGEEETFDFLSHYPNIKELWLIGCGLEDISFVSPLENLERCELEDNDISDYTPFLTCKKLEYLCIGLFGSNEMPDMPGDVEVVQETHDFGKEERVSIK